MKPVDSIVLIGHNSFVFDTPRLLRNGGHEFSKQLQEMKVLFTDSLPIIKFFRSQPNNVLKSSPNNKLGPVYKALLNCEFPAHNTLEDVKALRRILFSPPLEASSEIIVNRGKTCQLQLSSINFQASTFLEQRQKVVETYSGKLYLSNGSQKLTTTQKLADDGLAFSTLQEIYTKFGIRGLYGIIALPPSSRDSSCHQTKSPRITSNRRIISSVLNYFHKP